MENACVRYERQFFNTRSKREARMVPTRPLDLTRPMAMAHPPAGRAAFSFRRQRSKRPRMVRTDLPWRFGPKLLSPPETIADDGIVLLGGLFCWAWGRRPRGARPGVDRGRGWNPDPGDVRRSASDDSDDATGSDGKMPPGIRRRGSPPSVDYCQARRRGRSGAGREGVSMLRRPWSWSMDHPRWLWF